MIINFKYKLKMPGIKKKSLIKAGLILLSLYFIFDGLQHIIDYHKRSQSFDTKLYNIEATMQNGGWLLFRFSSFWSRFSKLIIFLYGLATLTSGIFILFFEEKKKRNVFLQVLVLLLIFDAFVLHNPFVEHLDSRSRELKHFMLSTMIGFSLLMICGYRSD